MHVTPIYLLFCQHRGDLKQEIDEVSWLQSMPHSKEDDGDQLRENLALQEPHSLVDVSEDPIVHVCRTVEIGYHVL